MRLNIFPMILLMTSFTVAGQRKEYVSAAVLSTQSDYPFGKFSKLVTQPLHPGFELGYGRNSGSKSKSEWFTELKLGYFYHRFVQHGIPLTLKFGYRYHFNSRFSLESSLGAGYLHSIPATSKFKLDENGEYENNKGLGRMQLIASLSLGMGYVFTPKVSKPLTGFILYQQSIQYSFVKSYVPLLPYNTLQIGVKLPLLNNQKQPSILK